MTKLFGIGLAVGSAVVLFGSMVSLGYPDVTKWSGSFDRRRCARMVRHP